MLYIFWITALSNLLYINSKWVALHIIWWQFSHILTQQKVSNVGYSPESSLISAAHYPIASEQPWKILWKKSHHIISYHYKLVSYNIFFKCGVFIQFPLANRKWVAWTIYFHHIIFMVNSKWVIIIDFSECTSHLLLCNNSWLVTF